MAHRPGCNQKGDHQPERVQVVTEQTDDPKPPDRGDQNATKGDQHTVGFAEMENEQGQHGDYGENEYLEDLFHIRVGPPHQDWLSRGVDLDSCTFLRFTQLL